MADKKFDLSVIFKMVDRFSAPLRRSMHIFNKWSGNVGKADRVTRTFGRNLTQLGGRMRRFGQGASIGITAPLALMGRGILNTAVSFESALNMMGAVTETKIGGKMLPMFVDLKNKAKDLGKTTQFTATDVANAMKFMGMAGMGPQKILGSIPNVLNLAASAQLDMASSADIITNIMASQQMRTKDLIGATDALSNVFISANVDLSQLGQAFKFAGSLTRAAGIDFSVAAAALGLMGNMGVQSTMAGRGLRMGLKELASPQKDAIKLFSKTGVKIFEINKAGKKVLRPLEDIVGSIHNAGLSTMDLMSAMSANAATALGALVDATIDTGDGTLYAGDALRWLAEKARRVGTSAAIAKAQMEGMPGIMKEMKSAWEAVQIAFSDSGFGRYMAGFFKRLTVWLRQLSESNPALLDIIAVVGMIMAVLGPLIIMIGALVAAIGAIVAFPVVAAVIAAITGSLILMTAAIVKMLQYKGRIASFFKSMAKSSVSAFESMWDGAKRFFSRVKNFLMDWPKILLNQFTKIVDWVANSLKKILPDWAVDFSPVGALQDTTRGLQDIVNNQNNRSEADITIKIQSDQGSTATINRVNKRGAANLKVINDSYLGFAAAGS